MELTLPHLSAMHPMHPDHVHEELELQLPDFSSYTLEWVARCPQWRDYYLAHDQTPHYAYLKTVLQILQWIRPGERWVLKSPQHLEQLGPLLATFPDATVVVTHRDPVSVVQSAATMMTYAARMSYRHPRPEFYLDYWTDRIRRLLEASVRDRTSSRRSGPVDVLFHEFMADDLATVERIYDVAGLAMTDEARAADRGVPRRPSPGARGPGRLRPPGRLRRRAPDEVRDGVRLLLRPVPGAGGGAMTIDDEVDRLIDERPGKELLVPRYDDPAHPVTDFLYRSGGTTAAYCLLTDARPGHRQHRHGLRGPPPQARLRRRAARPHPLRHHHPGPRRPRRRGRSCSASRTRSTSPRPTTRLPARRRPHPPLAAAHRRHLVRHDRDATPPDRRREPRRVDAPGHARCPTSPSTTASTSTWTDCASSSSPRWARPSTADRVAPRAPDRLISNLLGPLFPHFPNLNTLRGDRYRLVEPYLRSPCAAARAATRDARHRPPRADRRGRAHRRVAGPTPRRRRLRPPRDARRHERRERPVDLDARESASRRSSASARATARCPGPCARSGRPTSGGSSSQSTPSSTPTSTPRPWPSWSRRSGSTAPSTTPAGRWAGTRLWWPSSWPKASGRRPGPRRDGPTHGRRPSAPARRRGRRQLLGERVVGVGDAALAWSRRWSSNGILVEPVMARALGASTGTEWDRTGTDCRKRSGPFGGPLRSLGHPPCTCPNLIKRANLRGSCGLAVNYLFTEDG